MCLVSLLIPDTFKRTYFFPLDTAGSSDVAGSCGESSVWCRNRDCSKQTWSVIVALIQSFRILKKEALDKGTFAAPKILRIQVSLWWRCYHHKMICLISPTLSPLSWLRYCEKLQNVGHSPATVTSIQVSQTDTHS